jgi:hypothetical protein
LICTGPGGEPGDQGDDGKDGYPGSSGWPGWPGPRYAFNLEIKLDIYVQRKKVVCVQYERNYQKFQTNILLIWNNNRLATKEKQLLF